jgi:putative flippase GtrA
MPRSEATARAAEVKRVGKFGAVGVMNTGLDFLLYNVLHFYFGLGLIASNIISTTCAMSFSFIMNKRVVFRHNQDRRTSHQAMIFLAATAFGLYVLQTGIIAVLTSVWTEPMQLLVMIVHTLGLREHLSETFIVNNGAKALGTLVSMTWNYIIYKKVVFR